MRSSYAIRKLITKLQLYVCGSSIKPNRGKVWSCHLAKKDGRPLKGLANYFAWQDVNGRAGMAEPYRQMTLALVKRLAEEHLRPKAKVQQLRLIPVGVAPGKREIGEEK